MWMPSARSVRRPARSTPRLSAGPASSSTPTRRRSPRRAISWSRWARARSRSSTSWPSSLSWWRAHDRAASALTKSRSSSRSGSRSRTSRPRRSRTIGQGRDPSAWRSRCDARLGPSGRPHPPRRRRRGCGGGRRWANVTSTADVVIIGGGVTGASLAFHLTGLGVGRVLVLERRFLAAGGTGHSVGIIRQLYPTPETSAMVLRSLRVFQRFRDVVGSEAGYVGCGALIGVSPAMRPKLETTLAVQRALGIRAELLEPDDVARVEPRVDPAGLGAVLYEPESGYGDPTAVTLGYAGAARRRGAVIEQSAEVVAIHQAGGRVTGVTTAGGERVDARYRRGYAGAFDITPDWMPILDESPVRGFFIAAGLSGHGFKLAPAVGELMAALIAQTTPPVSPAPFAFGRFTRSTVAGTFVASYLR